MLSFVLMEVDVTPDRCYKHGDSSRVLLGSAASETLNKIDFLKFM